MVSQLSAVSHIVLFFPVPSGGFNNPLGGCWNSSKGVCFDELFDHQLDSRKGNFEWKNENAIFLAFFLPVFGVVNNLLEVNHSELKAGCDLQVYSSGCEVVWYGVLAVRYIGDPIVGDGVVDIEHVKHFYANPEFF